MELKVSFMKVKTKCFSHCDLFSKTSLIPFSQFWSLGQHLTKKKKKKVRNVGLQDSRKNKISELVDAEAGLQITMGKHW